MEEILKLGDEISSFKLCSPSDDPDLQTAVIYGFKNLVKKFLHKSKKIEILADLRDLFSIQPEIETIYEVYDLHSDLLNLIDDIREISGNPEIILTEIQGNPNIAQKKKILEIGNQITNFYWESDNPDVDELYIMEEEAYKFFELSSRFIFYANNIYHSDIQKLIKELEPNLKKSDQKKLQVILNLVVEIIQDIKNPKFKSQTGDEMESIKPNPKNIFVVHGRNAEIRDSVFSFLGSIKLQPLEWSEARIRTNKTNPYIGQVLDVAFREAQAIIIIMDPEDVVYLHQKYIKKDDDISEREPRLQARPNVLFEAGMAMGRDENRTILIEIGNPKHFSDIAGRHVIRLTNSIGSRQEFAQRLLTAGCEIDLQGTQWHSVGNFEIENIEVIKSEKTNYAKSSKIKDETNILDDLTLKILMDLQKFEGKSEKFLDLPAYQNYSKARINISFSILKEYKFVKLNKWMSKPKYPVFSITPGGRAYLGQIGKL
ncbi:MAG: nucleotide-binding protein [Chloroflexi bacterium]|nr:nucleotide-binding protein [Chloroflexota bacterium]MBT4755905.1 nucleotide-binding protein [Chloroflexota bacterium]MBT6357442.1 nucleotide-binding protein [Chloroflexota bacterium]